MVCQLDHNTVDLQSTLFSNQQAEAYCWDINDSNIDLIDTAELAEIQDIYADHVPDAEHEHNSNTKPIAEVTTIRADPPAPSPYTPDVTERLPDSYRAGHPIGDMPFSKQRSPQHNHLFPFPNARDYKVARFFTFSKTPKTRIDHSL